MSGSSPHVTLTQVAAAAGVSLATTSYSLRNDPRIPRTTAERVQAVARKLGYRPNPRVSALMAHIRHARPVTVGERIAFLWLDAPAGTRSYKAVFDGANERAVQLGYTLEEFWLTAPGLTARRLQQILHSRGIAGVLISPRSLPQPRFKINWNWNLFSAAIIGTAESEPELHHAAHHHYGAMRLAMLHLEAAGKRKIAGILDKGIEERARRAWSAGFLAHHPLPDHAWDYLAQEDPKKPASLPPLVSWMKRRKPDAIVGVRAIIEYLINQGWQPPPNVTVLLLDSVPNPWSFGGIDQGERIIAANAVDLVDGQLRRNERGVPEHVKMLLFPGHLVASPSSREEADPSREADVMFPF
jgi:LacI family transcriptional regulator